MNGQLKFRPFGSWTGNIILILTLAHTHTHTHTLFTIRPLTRRRVMCVRFTRLQIRLYRDTQVTLKELRTRDWIEEEKGEREATTVSPRVKGKWVPITSPNYRSDWFEESIDDDQDEEEERKEWNGRANDASNLICCVCWPCVSQMFALFFFCYFSQMSLPSWTCMYVCIEVEMQITR